MNRDNLQQWWENSYRRQHPEPTDDLGLDSAELHLALQEPNQLPADYDYGNFSLGNPYDVDSEHSISPLTLLLLAVSYGLVVFGGVVGNSTLVLTLCSASSVRLRNPLLLAVCIADLLVTGISAPVTPQSRDEPEDAIAAPCAVQGHTLRTGEWVNQTSLS